MEHDANESAPAPYDPSSLDDAMVERYVAGLSNLAERTHVETWIRAHPDQGSALLVVRQRAAQPWSTPVTIDASAAHRRLWERLGLQDRAAANVAPDSRVGRSFVSRPFLPATPTFMWRAAIAVAACAAAVIAITVATRTARPTLDAGRVYATATGQRSAIQLSDGSRITLGPRSTLRVDSRYGAADRIVSLEGEGYFEIAPARTRPFRVQTGAVTTDVLGTAFNVRRYPGDTATSIAVTTGKVRVRNVYAAATLVAGMASRLSDSVRSASVSTADRNYADWTRDQLVFNNVAATDVLATLGRWYGYDFRMADSSLTGARVTATFRTADPAETMRLLKDVLNVTLTFKDTVVTLHARGAHAPAPVRGGRGNKAFSPTMEVGR